MMLTGDLVSYQERSLPAELRGSGRSGTCVPGNRQPGLAWMRNVTTLFPNRVVGQDFRTC